MQKKFPTCFFFFKSSVIALKEGWSGICSSTILFWNLCKIKIKKKLSNKNEINSNTENLISMIHDDSKSPCLWKSAAFKQQINI